MEASSSTALGIASFPYSVRAEGVSAYRDSIVVSCPSFGRHCYCLGFNVFAMSISFYLKVREPSFDLGSSFISSSFPICLCLLLLNF